MSLQKNIKEKIDNHKSLIESVFSLSVLNGLSVLLPLATLPYILRVVGMANYGVYSYVYVLIQYLLLISRYGFNYSATKQIAQNRENLNQINRIYNAVVISRMLLLLFGIFLFAILSFLLLRTCEHKLIFLFGIGMVLGDVLNPIWLYQGMEKMRYMTIVNVCSKLIFTLLVFILIRKESDFRYIMLYNSCGWLLAGVLSTIIAVRQFRIHFKFPTKEDIKFQFKEGRALFGTTAGVYLYKNSNIFILKFFVDDVAVGIYAAAEKIINGMQLLSAPISQALFPHMGHNFKKQSVSTSLYQLRHISIIFAGILVIFVFFVELLSVPIVNLICGSNTQGVVFIVRIMAPVILLGGLNSMLGSVGLVNLNRQKDFFVGVILAGCVSVLFLCSSVCLWGIKSAAIATVLAELVLLLYLLFSLFKIYNKLVLEK